MHYNYYTHLDAAHRLLGSTQDESNTIYSGFGPREKLTWDEEIIERRTSSEEALSTTNDGVQDTDKDRTKLFSFYECQYEKEFNDKAQMSLPMYMGRFYRHRWHLANLAHFNAIGQLRHDLDLVQAGVELVSSDEEKPDKVFIRGLPIPPIPIASFHIGTVSDHQHISVYRNDAECPESVLFIRKKHKRPADAGSTKRDISLVNEVSKSSVSSLSASRIPRIRQTKRIKIGDVLNGFLK